MDLFWNNPFQKCLFPSPANPWTFDFFEKLQETSPIRPDKCQNFLGEYKFHIKTLPNGKCCRNDLSISGTLEKFRTIILVVYRIKCRTEPNFPNLLDKSQKSKLEQNQENINVYLFLVVWQWFFLALSIRYLEMVSGNVSLKSIKKFFWHKFTLMFSKKAIGYNKNRDEVVDWSK